MHYWLRVFFTKFSLNRNDPVIVNSHDGALKICDVTQFYSPYSGGVRRYVEERQRYINAGGQHLREIIRDEKPDLIELFEVYETVLES